jgi:branched-chain amino acid transport system ATP-binding protein
MPEPLLTVTGLHAGYGPIEILRGVDLTVGEAEIVAVLGSNGAGKSTLNRTISGVLRARQGEIRFEDVSIARKKPSAIVARGLIHVPEGRRIFPNMSVRENLDLGAYRRARAATTTAPGCSAFFHGSPNAKPSAPAPCPAANSRCWRSGAD